jgi:hypothetical protein
MKKRIIIVLSIVITAAVLFSACSKTIANDASLSELRDNIFVGENDTYKVNIVSGIRENPFEIDGVSQKDKVYFTIITVTPKEKNPIAEYSFSTTISDTEYNGKLNKHPFNDTYSIEINTEPKASSIDVSITLGEESSIVTASSVKTEDFITADKAFEIAKKALSQKIKDKKADYEIFIRLIENPNNPENGYFWYVAFIYQDGLFGALIDPVSMKIVAIKD